MSSRASGPAAHGRLMPWLMPDTKAVIMMSTKCPDCNLELNEQLECALCGFRATDSLFEQPEGVTERDFSFAGVPFAQSDSAELAPEVAIPDDDKTTEFPTGNNDDDADGSREHAEVDDLSSEDADEGWHDRELLDDVMSDEEYQAEEEDALPPAAGGDSHNTTLGGNASAGQIINSSGEVNIFTSREAGPKDDERTLIDFTEVLPPKSSRLPKLVFEELPEYLGKLKDERLVLISCPDEDIAFSAAHALVDRLNLPQEQQRRLLNIDRSTGDDLPLSIYYLSGERDFDGETVVVVDATTEKAKPFLEPIIRANWLASDAIQDELRRNAMYMLCLLDPAQLEDGPRQARDLKFPCWRIPFLRRLLERYIEDPEELEKKIKEQRDNGLWSLNDSEFYFELKSYLLRGELPAEIEQRDKHPQIGPVRELFKGNEPLSDTVLYIATYFPNLTPYEFNQMVRMLCEGAAQVAKNGGAEHSKYKAPEPPGRSGEKVSLQVWREVPDQILKDCSLVTIPLRDATKGVNFSNHNLRDKLREHLEREYSFFLENRFQDIQELGLIFSPSAKIAWSAVQLSVEMAAAYPEYYGSSWLAALVTDFENSIASATNAEAHAWRFIREANAVKARKRFYQRLSELVRAMLEETRAAEAVEGFLQQLLISKHRGAVLEIVRRLQFAPAFDQFKWLKQLLYQGNQQQREQTNDYLRSYLKRMRGGIYQALGSLESWLPKDECPLQAYPVPARYALRLIYFYFLETNKRFDAKYYGAWPSAHPLFAFRDAETAASDISLLVRLLFHPGMDGVFRGQGINQARGVFFINRLVTAWFFILQRKGDSSVWMRGGGARGLEPGLDAPTVSNLLLEEIVRGVKASQQSALLDYWREESGRLLKALSNKLYGSAAWEEIAWKRDLLVQLINRYEQLRGAVAVV